MGYATSGYLAAVRRLDNPVDITLLLVTIVLIVCLIGTAAMLARHKKIGPIFRMRFLFQMGLGVVSLLLDTAYRYLDTPPVVAYLAGLAMNLEVLIITIAEMQVLKGFYMLSHSIDRKFIERLQYYWIAWHFVSWGGGYIQMFYIGVEMPIWLSYWQMLTIGWLLSNIAYETYQTIFLTWLLVASISDVTEDSEKAKTRVRRVQRLLSKNSHVRFVVWASACINVCDWTAAIMFLTTAMLKIPGKDSNYLLSTFGQMYQQIIAVHVLCLVVMLFSIKNISFESCMSAKERMDELVPTSRGATAKKSSFVESKERKSVMMRQDSEPSSVEESPELVRKPSRSNQMPSSYKITVNDIQSQMTSPPPPLSRRNSVGIEALEGFTRSRRPSFKENAQEINRRNSIVEHQRKPSLNEIPKFMTSANSSLSSPKDSEASDDDKTPKKRKSQKVVQQISKDSMPKEFVETSDASAGVVASGTSSNTHSGALDSVPELK
ncbi:hypothetical protein EDD86DRAFT_252269 [Gorgonomyces haynaldii]|nr:hypothetical protein EDD86DRAFT_252269 [Gorgonomyces haynaldii]